jgi:hypothetical protein
VSLSASECALRVSANLHGIELVNLPGELAQKSLPLWFVDDERGQEVNRSQRGRFSSRNDQSPQVLFLLAG